MLAASLIVTGGAFTYHQYEQGQYRDRTALANDMRLLSQRIATSSLEAAGGSERAFENLESLRDGFQARLNHLQEGGGGLKPLPAALQEEFSGVSGEWSSYLGGVNAVLRGQSSIEMMGMYSEAVEMFSPELSRLSDDVVRRMSSVGADPEQVYIASRQTLLVQRIENSLSQVLRGGAEAEAAIERFERDATLFGRVLDGLIEGYDELGVEAVDDARVQAFLQESATVFIAFSEAVAGVLEASSAVLEVSAAASSIEASSAGMLDVTSALESGIAREADSLSSIAAVGYATGGLAFLLLIALGLLLHRDTRRELAQTEAQNERNNMAIVQLLDEMANLADGDLTVNATVSEDFTGAIADSMNFAIENLRSLVSTINKASADINDSSSATRSQVLGLAEKSEEQVREIQQANAAIDDMSQSVNKVAEDAGQSAQVARNSVEIASKGAATVRRSIEGMDTIREQIQETAKRIKRLGESSQEIGDIIGLINDIAEQTNVLALNAAIQASAAGEAGRGFAVVADEVQRLAERSSSATRQVEGLVKAIQADTSEAVSSMEQSTANVVHGGELAQAAGKSLAEIEQVSSDLAQLIDGISSSARKQSVMAKDVSGIMSSIREISSETAQGTQSTAAAMGDLTDLSAKLRSSVSDFKLPDTDTTEPAAPEGTGSSASSNDEMTPPALKRA
ncbi:MULTISPECIES: methyl-accepting chemotaxis protein [unclassified Thioalkalivibrio]|uniref:methyl-accepting chemotaxis protein n=1 Tax=unclassified Thioalkalivibrio TaxID=2621013 RepID=UPI00035F4918